MSQKSTSTETTSAKPEPVKRSVCNIRFTICAVDDDALYEMVKTFVNGLKDAASAKKVNLQFMSMDYNSPKDVN